MARVNHKLVKQRLNEARSKITDRQFFSSRLLAGHFEDIAAVQSRRYRYNRRVHVNLYWKPEGQDVAKTDNFYIYINTGHPLITNVRGRENRYQIVCGIFTHELGHVLYTDFLELQSYKNYLRKQHWYPSKPDLKTAADIKNEEEFWEYVKSDKKNLEAVGFVASQLENILEDGYIENRMLNDFPGTLGYGLETLRNLQFEQMPTVTQLKESEENGNAVIFQSLISVLLSYAKFSEIKYGDEPLTDKRIQIIFSLMNAIDAATRDKSIKERFRCVNQILVSCWEDIKEFCERYKQAESEAEKSGEKAEEIAKSLGNIPGSSKIGTGKSTPVIGPENPPAESETAGSGTKNKPNAPPNSEKGASGAEMSAPEAEGIDTGVTETKKQEVSETEQGRIPLQQTESISEPEGGTIERNTDYEREQDERAAKDIERILEKMAEKAACTELENERIQELNEAAQSISYGNIHAGVNVRINRINDIDEKLVEQYDQISAPLLQISRQLQKNLIRQLQDSRRGGKQTGLLMGRRLETHSLHRNDGKVFYKNVLPNEIPQLAVGLLLDESGSMSSCDRCTYARAAAIILFDFCQSLDIPVMVYGHSTDYGIGKPSVELYSYAEFEEYDQNDKYRLMDIGARHSNRDGAALRFVAEQLSKREEEVKMLILVSDGQPADMGYIGTAAEEDLRGIQREYQKKGLLFIAAAIGDDKENIERIYGDSYLDITDLSQLPIKLTSVVKRHIRV